MRTDYAVNGQEPLRVLGGLEPAHPAHPPLASRVGWWEFSARLLSQCPRVYLTLAEYEQDFVDVPTSAHSSFVWPIAS